MVLFSPEDHRITSGSPAERRAFLDILLSQADSQYLKNLQDFNRVLRQRNRLLSLIASGEASENDLNVWDNALAKQAWSLTRKRIAFLQQIEHKLVETYANISANSERLKARYSFADDSNLPDEEAFLLSLKKLRKKEIILKRTLVGPHRDDVVFFLNDLDVRKHASRGEQKSVLLTLKIVEYEYLHEKKKKTPILLLDDLHSELDEYRQEQFLNSLTELGQTFITTVEKSAHYPEGAMVYKIRAGGAELVTP